MFNWELQYYGGVPLEPVTDPMTLGSVVKVIGSWEKGCENAESVMNCLT